MEPEIDARAVVGKGVEIGEGSRVGAYAVIEDGVRIGKGNTIWPHAFLGRGTTLGDRNHVHPFAVIGHVPQDVSFDPSRETFLVIGDENVFREHATVHRASKAGQATVIGDRCYIMSGAHVAHDCKVGNGLIMVNGASLTGHCEAHDGAIMSGFTGVHQFSRIGRLAMMSALSVSNKDLPPFFIFGGRPACAQGLNSVGLRRAGYSREVRAEIKRAYRAIYREGRTLKEALEVIERECPSEPCRYLVEFVRGSKRGIAAGAAEQFDTLRPHYNRGTARRGTGEAAEGAVPADDEDESTELL